MISKKAFVTTPHEMFEKMKLEFDDFKLNPKSSRHAINFVLTAHHLKEWVWKSYLKKNEYLRKSISTKIEDKETFYSYLNSECKETKLVRELANNVKHFYLTLEGEIQETTNGEKPWEDITCTWENYNVPWDYDGLIVVTKDGAWSSALDIFQTTHDYWVNFFNRLDAIK